MSSRSLSGEDVKKYGKMWEIWQIPLFGSSTDRLLDLLDNIGFDKPIWIATVNPEFVMAARKDGDFLKILQRRTTLNIMDGVGLAWARLVIARSSDQATKQSQRDCHGLRSRNDMLGRLWWGLKAGVEILQGGHRDDLITGADLVDRLCAKAEVAGKSVYFYGGWKDRSERTAEYFLKKYPGLKVVGARAEDFDFNTKADYLFVARAMKKQELWINENLEKLKVGLVMGVGRTFDYYSGDLKRAPVWVRRMGLEWLFSLIVEPKRWRRQLELPKFVWKVIVN